MTDKGDSWSGWFRHQCEVRYVLSRRCVNAAFARDFLDGVEKHRGKAARDHLENDTRTQWQRGNRGASGDWREEDYRDAL